MRNDETQARNNNIQCVYESRRYSLRDVGLIFKLSHERIRQILTKREVKMNPPKALRKI